MSGPVLQVSRTIAASPQAIFSVLADPAQHHVIDGSGYVGAPLRDSPERLALGATFGMHMRFGVPYRIENSVVEFEEPTRIAWRHFGGHIWRYVLQSGDGGTLVTKTFDATTGRGGIFYALLRVTHTHPPAMARTLERLDRLVTTGSPE